MPSLISKNNVKTDTTTQLKNKCLVVLDRRGHYSYELLKRPSPSCLTLYLSSNISNALDISRELVFIALSVYANTNYLENEESIVATDYTNLSEFYHTIKLATSEVEACYLLTQLLTTHIHSDHYMVAIGINCESSETIAYNWLKQITSLWNNHSSNITINLFPTDSHKLTPPHWLLVSGGQFLFQEYPVTPLKDTRVNNYPHKRILEQSELYPDIAYPYLDTLKRISEEQSTKYNPNSLDPHNSSVAHAICITCFPALIPYLNINKEKNDIISLFFKGPETADEGNQKSEINYKLTARDYLTIPKEAKRDLLSDFRRLNIPESLDLQFSVFSLVCSLMKKLQEDVDSPDSSKRRTLDPVFPLIDPTRNSHRDSLADSIIITTRSQDLNNEHLIKKTIQSASEKLFSCSGYDEKKFNDAIDGLNNFIQTLKETRDSLDDLRGIQDEIELGINICLYRHTIKAIKLNAGLSNHEYLERVLEHCENKIQQKEHILSGNNKLEYIELESNITDFAIGALSEYTDRLKEIETKKLDLLDSLARTREAIRDIDTESCEIQTKITLMQESIRNDDSTDKDNSQNSGDTQRQIEELNSILLRNKKDTASKIDSETQLKLLLASNKNEHSKWIEKTNRLIDSHIKNACELNKEAPTVTSESYPQLKAIYNSKLNWSSLNTTYQGKISEYHRTFLKAKYNSILENLSKNNQALQSTVDYLFQNRVGVSKTLWRLREFFRNTLRKGQLDAADKLHTFLVDEENDNKFRKLIEQSNQSTVKLIDAYANSSLEVSHEPTDQQEQKFKVQLINHCIANQEEDTATQIAANSNPSIADLHLRLMALSTQTPQCQYQIISNILLRYVPGTTAEQQIISEYLENHPEKVQDILIIALTATQQNIRGNLYLKAPVPKDLIEQLLLNTSLDSLEETYNTLNQDASPFYGFSSYENFLEHLGISDLSIVDMLNISTSTSSLYQTLQDRLNDHYHRVFICYATSDGTSIREAIAQEINNFSAISNHNIQVLADNNLHSGTPWLETLSQMIELSNLYIVIVTDNSLNQHIFDKNFIRGFEAIKINANIITYRGKGVHRKKNVLFVNGTSQSFWNDRLFEDVYGQQLHQRAQNDHIPTYRKGKPTFTTKTLDGIFKELS